MNFTLRDMEFLQKSQRLETDKEIRTELNWQLQKVQEKLRQQEIMLKANEVEMEALCEEVKELKMLSREKSLTITGLALKLKAHKDVKGCFLPTKAGPSL